MPNVPYSYEVNGKLVTGNGSLLLISSSTKRSLLPSLTVVGLANNDLRLFFSKVLETLEVDHHISKVSRTLLKKPQIVLSWEIPQQNLLYDGRVWYEKSYSG